jgi:dTDP-4-amino-4,6-dideoxygalactose transaminase
LLALKACGIEAGDEVIVPVMTFCATAEAVCHLGALPVFVDAEPETLGIDPVKVEAAITPRTKAILPVHLHGWPVPMGPLFALAERFGLAIVEDCAQAHGSSEEGHPVGSRSRAGCFSFFPGKNLGALGDAGMVVTNDQALADRMRALADHGRRSKFTHEEVGYNARLDELQAAFLNAKLPHLEAWNEERRQLASRYNQGLARLPLQLPPAPGRDRVPSFHLYVVHCASRQERDGLREFLGRHEIETGVHYPVPLHLLPAFADHGYLSGDFPVAEQAAARMLSLPIFPGLRSDEQQTVIEAVGRFFSARGTDGAAPVVSTTVEPRTEVLGMAPHSS